MDSIAIKNEIKQKILRRIEERLNDKGYDEMDFDELVYYIHLYRNNPTEIAAIIDAIMYNPNLSKPERDRLVDIINEVTEWW
ncbi:hypothetical protein DRO29_06150 [Candidatus Bathyarchaeota archaeon]|nr:MAG: hypothetical protein DRO29_06150 [Candidatus Bathyarchaeota archaeon]